jgi:hypothetical protein
MTTSVEDVASVPTIDVLSRVRRRRWRRPRDRVRLEPTQRHDARNDAIPHKPLAAAASLRLLPVPLLLPRVRHPRRLLAAAAFLKLRPRPRLSVLHTIADGLADWSAGGGVSRRESKASIALYFRAVVVVDDGVGVAAVA